MKYTKIALILYAIALLVFITVGAVGGMFKEHRDMYEGFEEGVFLFFAEPAILIIAIIFAVLAFVKAGAD